MNQKVRICLVLLAVFLSMPSTQLGAQGFGETNEYLSKPERHDIGVAAGIASYMGDFNETNIIYQPSYYGALFYRYSSSRYVSVRLQAGTGQFRGDSKGFPGGLPGLDKSAILKFERTFFEAGLLAEFNFLPFHPSDMRSFEVFSPYLVLGVGALLVGNQGIQNNSYLQIAAIQYPGIYQDPNSTSMETTIYIPMGFGFKLRPAKRLTLSMELVLRKTFTDNLDGFTSRGSGESILINDDWVSTVSLGLSYRLPINRTCDAYSPVNRPTSSLKGYQPAKSKKSAKKKAKKPLSKNKQPQN